MSSILTNFSASRPVCGFTLFVCALSFCASGTSQAASTFITRTIFDDYTDAFDTTGLIGPDGFIKAFPDPPPVIPAMPNSQPNSQSVSTVLTTTDSAGATRLVTLTHLDPAYDPAKLKGNSSAYVNTNLALAPNFLGFGTDTSAPTRLDVGYDFTTTGSGSLDAATGNSHILVSVLDTDGGDNTVSATLSFTDLNGIMISRTFTELGVDVAVTGEKLVPFDSFPGVDFSQLSDLDISWVNPGEAQYDGMISLVGAGTLSASVPEPSLTLPLLSILAMTLSRRKRAK